jgi:hypothetical protein
MSLKRKVTVPVGSAGIRSLLSAGKRDPGAILEAVMNFRAGESSAAA